MWMFPKIVVYTPKSSILIGFSIINHPFWGTLFLGNTHMTLLESDVEQHLFPHHRLLRTPSRFLGPSLN